MRRLLTVLLVLAALVVPVVAWATVGGPSTMALLGHAPGDRKVFVLESFHDEGERLPQLYFIRLDGAQRGKLVPVRSYYRLPADEASTAVGDPFEVGYEHDQAVLVPTAE